MGAKECIEAGRAILGIEFGSTRIKAVLVDENHTPIAQGSHEWENRYDNKIWTYTMEDIHTGLQDCYADMVKDVQKQYGVTPTSYAAMGFSAMMHGYLAFNEQGELLVPFRTWRNTITGEAAAQLTEAFHFNIPQRWSISHLYQAILNNEPHVPEIRFFTTLAGYIHWKLTGEKVLGVGDASGMFPIDAETGNYNQKMIAKFDELVADKGFAWTLSEILPKVLSAGEDAGVLTEEGAKFLDPVGNLQAGIPLCPPEGDAGTGMTATNSVGVRTGNVSAGTSIFAMVVMEKDLPNVHEELDMVTTPDGKPVAMVHCNNCTSDLNAWVRLFAEYNEAAGIRMDMNTLYGTLYRLSLEGDADCSGLVSYNYYSGEPVTGLMEGRPMQIRMPDSAFTLANFMRSNLYSSMATLKVGLDILLKEEKVPLEKMYGHGGLFKTKGVGQRYMAAAMNAPVSLMETAGEGGAWGIAVLAAYLVQKAEGQTLPAYLNDCVFAGMEAETMAPDPEDVAGFDKYMEGYVAGLAAQKAAVEALQ